LFKKLRFEASAIVIRKHAYADHPERLFTRQELLSLVLSGRGEIFENNIAATAKPGSFLPLLTDLEKRECEIALMLDEYGSWKIVVIHAFRRV
jgi:hypothetical protein